MTDKKTKIFNKCNFSINIYDIFIEKQPTSEEDTIANIYDYWPTYTLIGNVKANDLAIISLKKPIHRLVITKEENLFPISLHVISSTDDKVLHIVEEGFNRCEEAWKFYKFLRSQPYHPVSQGYFYELFVLRKNMDNLEEFFRKHGYSCGYDELYLVSFWATTYLYAYSGRYYVYQKGDGYQVFLKLSDKDCLGELEISNNTAIYTPAKGEQISLFYKYGVLVKEDVDIEPFGSSKNPIKNFKGWTLMLQNLNLAGEPEKIVACFIGKIEGMGGEQPVIAQPYQLPGFLWWAPVSKLGGELSDMTIGLGVVRNEVNEPLSRPVIDKFLQASFNKLEQQEKFNTTCFKPEHIDISQEALERAIGILFRMVVLSKSQLCRLLAKNVAFIDALEIAYLALKNWEKQKGKEESCFIAFSKLVETGLFTNYMMNFKGPIKDRWVLLSQQLSSEEKDLKNKRDQIKDPDVIGIPQGALEQAIEGLYRMVVLSKSQVYKFLAKNVAFIDAIETIYPFLKYWKEEEGEKEICFIAPSELLGIVLLTNYMINSKEPIKTRWVILGQFVQQLSSEVEGLEGRRDLINKQLVTVTCIIEIDGTSEEISWSEKQENDLIAQMAQYANTENQHEVYSELLANYQTVDKKGLPIKTGCTTVKKHLIKLLNNIS